MTEQTNNTTAAAAVEPQPLPLDETTVIGIFQRPQGASALIRLATGEILSVAVGDSIGTAEVTVIADNGLYLLEGGRETTLVMPAG